MAISPTERAKAAEKKLEDFKTLVIKETLNWPAGCKSGKIEFLESLGLEAPKNKWRILVEIDASDSEDDLQAHEVSDQILDSINCYGGFDDVWIVEAKEVE
jgi:hypothetical protein